jgi:APA family basic amino acid/polyamine antiporter
MSELPRILVLRDLVFLILTTVIGAGIFLVPGTVLSQVNGHIPSAMTAWLLGGILSLLGALTFGELSATHPKAGGLYIYIRDCFGRTPAFIFGWALFFAIGNGAIATLAVAMTDTLSAILDLTPFAGKIISVGMIILLAAVNVRGTRHSANLQNFMTIFKIAALAAMSLVFLFFGRGSPGSQEAVQTGHFSVSLSSMGLAMIGVLWAYEGWQHGTYSAGEAVNAHVNYPKAYMIGTATMIGIYILANWGYLAALGPAEVADSQSVAADAMMAIGSPFGAQLIVLVIAVSIFSAANGIILTTSRVSYAMARDGLFFRSLAHVHPRYKTPAFAVMAGCGWAAVLALSASFQQLLTYVVFSGWIFYALGAASIFVYRKRIPVEEIPYKVPGYPWTPLIFVITSTCIVINSVVNELIHQPVQSSLALGIIALAIPVYLLWHRSSRSAL